MRDLLYFFPHRHIDYSQTKCISQLTAGEEQTIVANVWQAQETMLGGRRGTEAIVGDETGNIRVVWFNQPYLAKRLPTNTRVVLSGRVSLFKGQYVFESPEWEIVEDKTFERVASRTGERGYGNLFIYNEYEGIDEENRELVSVGMVGVKETVTDSILYVQEGQDINEFNVYESVAKLAVPVKVDKTIIGICR